MLLLFSRKSWYLQGYLRRFYCYFILKQVVFLEFFLVFCPTYDENVGFACVNKLYFKQLYPSSHGEFKDEGYGNL